MKALIYLSIIATGIHAQTVDTTILKNGNTWLYVHHEEYRTSQGLFDGFDGTARYTIDSLAKVGDTVKFTVIQKDSGQLLVWPVGSDRNVFTVSATRFKFSGGNYSPTTPLFAIDQSFTGAEPRSVYRGDTVRVKSMEASGCMYESNRNVQKLGRVLQSSGHGGCGNTSSSYLYRLIEFNGSPYASDSLKPVSLLRTRLPSNSGAKASPRVTPEGRVLFGNKKEAYDTRGQKVVIPPTKAR